MSHKATHWAWSCKDISSSEKLSLLALADRHNADSGDCFPSLDRISDDTMMSKDTVRRATQSLEQKGLLSRRLVLDKFGRTLGYAYTLHMGDSTMLPLEDSTMQGVGLHHATHGDSTMLPKPVKETSKRNLYRSENLTEFTEFWNVYPRKAGKGAAEKAWLKATRSVDASKILVALRGFKFSSDPEFIPHPATWLNQKRYEDFIQPEAKISAELATITDRNSANYMPWRVNFSDNNLKFRLHELEKHMDEGKPFFVPKEFP